MTTTIRLDGFEGITLGCAVSGTGRPLLAIHGTSADHSRWDPVRDQLAQGHALHALDRRGRSLSDDAQVYDLEQEIGDVAVLAARLFAATGQPVDLLAHSFGALCTIHALANGLDRIGSVRRVVLYEPPLPFAPEPITPPEVLAEMEALMREGDREGVVNTFLRKVVRVPEHEYALLRNSPNWTNRVAAAHTIPRELRAIDADGRLGEEDLARIDMPLLLILGGDSPDFLAAATRLIASTVPGARLEVLPGHAHNAMSTAPERFVALVRQFFDEAGESR